MECQQFSCSCVVVVRGSCPRGRARMSAARRRRRGPRTRVSPLPARALPCSSRHIDPCHRLMCLVSCAHTRTHFAGASRDGVASLAHSPWSLAAPAPPHRSHVVASPGPASSRYGLASPRSHVESGTIKVSRRLCRSHARAHGLSTMLSTPRRAPPGLGMCWS
jgi:hypothetical protein